MTREATVYTGESTLRRTVCLIDTATVWTGARGIAWIDRKHFDALTFRLVLDKHSELEKRPAMPLCALRLTNRYPIANATEFFEGDPATGVFSRIYNGFADVMVYPGRETTLFARQLLELTSCRMGLSFLELGSQLAMAVANVVHSLCAMHYAIAIDGDIFDAEVNAENIFNILWCRFVNVASREQIEVAADEAQIGLAALVLKQFSVIVTADKLNLLSAAKYPNRNFALVEFPGKDAGIVGDCAQRLEGALRGLVKLIGITHFRDTADNQLCRQVKLRFDGVVRLLVDLELTKRFGVPSQIAHAITSGVCGFECTLQAFSLCFGRF